MAKNDHREDRENSTANVPPKPSDVFSPEGGRSEGLDAFRFFLNTASPRYYNVDPM